MGFGDILRELREEKGMTQRELGRIINISDRVIGYYEANNRFPKDEYVLKKLADFFGVSLDYLVGRTSKRMPLDEYIAESPEAYDIRLGDLPDEAIQRVKEYVELMRLKYKNTAVRSHGKSLPGKGSTGRNTNSGRPGSNK